MTALNITPFIEAESDRIIGDDLITGPQTHTVSGVEGTIDEKKKKRLIVRLEGQQKPFMPCKGMTRLLGHLWGPDAAQWVGRALVLYRDPDVRFGADTTGGVRICAVSNIERAVKVPIRTSQKSVKSYDVEPLVVEAKPDPARKWADAYIGTVNNAADLDTLNGFANERAVKLAELESKRPELHSECVHALSVRRDALAMPQADDFAADDDIEDFGS